MFKLEMIGNLVADPTLQEVVNRNTNEVLKVCHFRVAVNRRINGQQQTTYVNCSAWRGLAEPCKTYLNKGKKVWISGTPDARRGTGQDGTVYANLEVAVREIEFLSPRSNQEETVRMTETQAPAEAAPQAPEAPVAPAAPDNYTIIDESYLPF